MKENELATQKTYKPDEMLEVTTPGNHKLFVGVRLDENSQIILDCKWSVSDGTPDAIKDILAQFSELSIGQPWQAVKAEVLALEG